MKNNALLLILTLLLASLSLCGQNLIVNPSGETGASDGWTIVKEGSTDGDCWNNSDWRIVGGVNGFPAAHDGTSYFYCGCALYTAEGTLEGEVYQNVDVSGYAADIDAGTAEFTFSGYLQTWSNNGIEDKGRIKVEYLDAGGTLLDSYDSGILASVNVWTQLTDTKNAPAGTRTIRVSLLSYLWEQFSVDAYFDDLSLTTTAELLLPVELTSFSGQVLGSKTIRLNWETASETENERFIVEESLSGDPFRAVGEVAGKGTSASRHQYAFDLVAPQSSLAYYRLKQISLDGTFTYSKTISLTLNGSKERVGELYPNPSRSGWINLNYQAVNDDALTVTVFDFWGKRVMHRERKLTSGNNNLRFDLSDLKAGTYLVKLEPKTGSASHRKLVIQK